MKVGVIGLGHVGKNVVRRLRRMRVDVVEFDRAFHDEYPARALADCDFVTICVGTPRGGDGSADLTDVMAAVQEVPTARVLIRSTVPPGTTDKLVSKTGKTICFSPEYVGETSFSQEEWNSWADDQAFQIVGGKPEETRWFAERLTEINGAGIRIFTCTAVEAELAKYMENAYFAMKVTFANQFFDLCEAIGANWFTVREAWLLDPRIERDHTAVFTRSRGFDGRCLPKDLDSIIHTARNSGILLDLLEAVRNANDRYLRESFN